MIMTARRHNAGRLALLTKRTGIEVNSPFSTMTEQHGGTALQWCRKRHAELGDGWGHARVEAILG